MKTAILACNTIRDELLLALEHTNCQHELFWVESNLHNFPDKLNFEIQKFLDKLDGYDRVLLAFGFCGNSIANLQTYSFELIVPRVDDCISLLIGSVAERVRLGKETWRIYLTKGWLQNEANMWSEYQHILAKYGEKKAKYVMDAMYGHYELLSVVDTGAYDLSAVLPTAEKMGQGFDLAVNVIAGTTSYLEQLLTGPYDSQRFIIVQPHSHLSIDELSLS